MAESKTIIVVIILIILALLFASGSGSGGQGSLSLEPSFSFSPSFSPSAGGGGYGSLTWVLAAGALTGAGAYYWRRNRLLLSFTPESPTEGDTLTLEATLIKEKMPAEGDIGLEIVAPRGAEFKDPAGQPWPDKRKINVKTDKDGKFSVGIDTTGHGNETIRVVATADEGKLKADAEILVAARQGTGTGPPGGGTTPPTGKGGTPPKKPTTRASKRQTTEHELKVVVVKPSYPHFDMFTRETYLSGPDREEYYYMPRGGFDDMVTKNPKLKKYADHYDKELKSLLSRLRRDLKKRGVPMSSTKGLVQSHYDILLFLSFDAIGGDSKSKLFNVLRAKWNPKKDSPGYGVTIFTAPSFRHVRKVLTRRSGIIPNLVFLPKEPFVKKTKPKDAEFKDTISCNIDVSEGHDEGVSESLERIVGQVITPVAADNESPWDAATSLIFRTVAEGHIKKDETFPLMTYLNFDLWDLRKNDRRYGLLLDTLDEAIAAMRTQLQIYESKQQSKKTP